MTKRKSKALSFFLTIALLFTMNVGMFSATIEHASAKSHKYSRDEFIRGGGDKTTRFKIKGMIGLCQHGGPKSMSSIRCQSLPPWTTYNWDYSYTAPLYHIASKLGADRILSHKAAGKRITAKR